MNSHLLIRIGIETLLTSVLVEDQLSLEVKLKHRHKNLYLSSVEPIKKKT